MARFLTKAQATAALNKTLVHFISTSQCKVMVQLSRGEEGQFFIDKMVELAAMIEKMPKTMEQDGRGDKAIVYLHYFKGGCDWFIYEKDMETEQHQAFGLADLFGDGGELGYISIVELLANNVELDLHWTPKTLGEVKVKR